MQFYYSIGRLNKEINNKKNVFLFLFPVVELSQRLDVGKSQPDIMEQKSMDYG